MTVTSTATLTIPGDLYNEIKALAESADQSEVELLVEAIRAFEREQLRKRFASIGAIHDPGLQGRHIDEQLKQHWPANASS